MSYVLPNFQTKKALRDAVAAKQEVTVYNPRLGSAPRDGMATIEGPHFPQPHKWYAVVQVAAGRVVKVIS